MRKGLAISAVVVAGLAVTVTSAAPAAAGSRPVREPDGVTVEIVGYYGSGCPTGTVWAAILSDNKRLSVHYEGPLAQTGGSSHPLDRRKTCKVVLKLIVPKGFTYAISSSSNAGDAFMEEGAYATVKLGHFFQESTPSEVTHTIYGPFGDRWRFADRPPSDSIIWKPCNVDWNLNFTSDLQAYQGSSEPSKISYISMETEDASSHHHLYDLAWKTCP
ncbi:DUF4360 domain-containing protein [Actinomadura spongiicola]|uniref:DUF4360 domain-containing protein n=1 Tax=Actinomadura spongiicola TaxID=2303421 RepID=A0A372GP61_9ACTN|nr:DUF4360 domain-containing protein [Actinomadura spongiicola]RFS87154.1 DUF4360 domain-containing protein [Actinomadura spongiicola]